MSEFKNGDWVVSHNGSCSRISCDEEAKALSTVYKEYYEMWQPKAGDYCWFYSPTEYNRSYYKDRINLKFGRFEKYVEDRVEPYRFKDVDGVDHSATHCEPYIGTIPTIIKDSQ